MAMILGRGHNHKAMNVWVVFVVAPMIRIPRIAFEAVTTELCCKFLSALIRRFKGVLCSEWSGCFQWQRILGGHRPSVSFFHNPIEHDALPYGIAVTPITQSNCGQAALREQLSQQIPRLSPGMPCKRPFNDEVRLAMRQQFVKLLPVELGTNERQ